MKRFYFTILNIVLAMAVSKSVYAKSGMPQLNTEFWPAQIFWLILTFSILYILIWKVFLPKIIYSIENRKSRIVEDLEEAQKLKEVAENKLKEYNQIIENSKKEAKKIIAENKKKLEDDIASKKIKFDSEIEKELAAVEKEVNDLKKSSIVNINKIAVEISSKIIEKVIQTELNKSSISAIVEDISKKRSQKYL